MNRHYLKLILFLSIALANTMAIAQDRTISGTVLDSEGGVLPGVGVTVKGTESGTLSDTSGRYSITVPDQSMTLVFSFIGFVTKEVKIGNQTEVNVKMEQDVIRDYWSVETALGIPRPTNALQSSITQISGDNFTQARELNLATPLEGRIAGVNVTKVASGPAASTRVVIRGAKSLGSSNQPLYVVDGIPIDNSNFGQSGVWGGPDNGDGLNSINPDDIQSMTVLKGAASSALYGSRGANGVIMITTKKSMARKGIGVEFNSNIVAEKVINYTDFQKSHGAGGYLGTSLDDAVATKAAVISSPTEPDWNDAFVFNLNSQGWGPKFDGTDVVQPDRVIRKYSYAGDNWKRFYKTGVTLSNSIALSGGSEALNLRLSYGNLKNKGVVPNSGFDRDNLMLSLRSRFLKKVSLVSKVMYSHEDAKNRPMISDSPGNAVQALYVIPGDQNVELYRGDPHKLGAVAPGMTTPDGKSVGEEFQATSNLWGQNPYWAAYQYINSDTRDRVIASANLRYEISEFLYASGQVGVDGYTRRGTNSVPEGTGYRREGSFSEAETRVSETNYQWMLGFDKRYRNYHKLGVNAFVGGNNMRNKHETIDRNYMEYGINSLFASSEISWNDFLFVTATARKDWLSLLAEKENHIFNPSIGSSFVFTEVSKGLAEILSFGKIRASFAQVGNASALPTSPGLPPAINLTPPTSKELELGLDVSFLNGRVGLDLTYYVQATANDIGYIPLNPLSGFDTAYANVGRIQNRGIEVLITGSAGGWSSGFKWDVSLNFAMNKNKVSLIDGVAQVSDEAPRTRTVRIAHMDGQPFGMITGIVQYKTPDGRLLFNSNGAPRTDGQYHILGNGVHKFTGGLNNSFTYKSFKLDFLIDFKFGGQIYSGTNVRMTQNGYTKESLQGRAGETPLTVTGAVETGMDGSGNPTYSNFTKTLTPGEAWNYWNQFGDKAGDQFVYDASFVKLRQLALGYSLPKSILGKTPLKTVTLSVVSRNLALLYKKTPNIDPESGYSSSNAQGLDYFGMPPTRTYGFNLKVTY